MRHGRLSGLLVCIGCLFASATTLRAQQTPRAPTDGLQLPDRSVTTQSDAASVEVNPAGLGFIESAEARYTLEFDTALAEDAEANFADQHALFAGAGNDWIGGGFGIQLLDRPVIAEQRTNFQKYSLSGALRPTKNWSIGFGTHWFGTGADRRLNDLSSVDVGTQWRPSHLLGFGLALRDVNHPFLQISRGLPVRIQGGAALRLFGGRLVVDQQLNWIPDDDDTRLAYQPRLDVTPFSGFRLFGRANFPLDSDFSYRTNTATRIFGGVEVSLGRVGLASAANFRSSGPDNQEGYAGQTQSIWMTPRPRASLVRPAGRWVEIELDGNLAERAFDSPFGSSRESFLELQMYLRELADDPSVDGVVLKIGRNDLGYGQLWELRQQIAHLHDSGKKTAAFLTDPSFSSTYLASAASRLYLTPAAPYSPEGIRSTTLHYAQALSNVGIEAEFIRIGEYKSAPESYIRREPSEPALEQREAIVDGLYDEVVSSLAEDRQLQRQAVERAVDNVPVLPSDAVEDEFADDVAYPDEVYTKIRESFGASQFLTDRYDPNPAPTQGWDGGPEVAVVYVDGNIVRGESNESPLFGEVLSGSETITEVLGQVGRDPSIRAVVLRVDSPGGSAVASDMIYREIRRIAQVKPVVASMGNVAASGGYYVASGADTIFATPNTMTGSIGIFTGKFSIGRLADVLGINQSEIERGERAAQFDLFEPWSEEQRKSARQSIQYLYRLFLEQVSKTRPLTSEEVDEVARGRVWLGEQARDEKLVDQTGGLVDAIRYAENAAGIPPGSAKYRSYPQFGALLNVPLAQAGVLGKLAEWLGIETSSGQLDPQSALDRIADRLHRAVLLPLLYDQREPLMLPPEPLIVGP